MIIKCFKSSLVRYLNPANHHPARITKTAKDFGKKLDFKDLNFPVKIRDIHKIEKHNSISISFLAMKIKKIYNPCIKKMLSRKSC